MMADMNGMSQELQRLVSKRMEAELQALQIKFLMAFVAVLFALAATSLCQGWLKSRLNKDEYVGSRHHPACLFLRLINLKVNYSVWSKEFRRSRWRGDLQTIEHNSDSTRHRQPFGHRMHHRTCC
jgi:hypothetical protein